MSDAECRMSSARVWRLTSVVLLTFHLSPFIFHLPLLLVSFQLQANPIEFTESDAHVALAAASNLVERCTPRDAGTMRGRLAANWILDRVSRTGADAFLDKFRAPTPDGERTFANVTVEFPGTKTNAAWIVVMSHFDTMPNIGDGFQGANDGASTSGLLLALANALRRAGRQPESIALVWTDGEECRKAYGPDDGFQGSRRLAETFRTRQRQVKASKTSRSPPPSVSARKRRSSTRTISL